MNNLWQNSIFSGQYIPHGHCYLWQKPLVGLHITADLIIALSYYLIPLMLVYFLRQRQDIPFKGLFFLFGAFIVTCGTTHLMAIWTLWHPDYWLSGVIKAITALVSFYTVLLLFPVIPQALALPSPTQLQKLNQDLEQQMRDRHSAEMQVRQLNQDLEKRVEKRTQALKAVNEQLKSEVEDRQVLAQKLSSSETYIRSIFEAITDIILVLDEECQVTEIPPTRSSLIWESEAENLIDRTIKQLLRKDRIDEYREKVQQVLATQKPLILDYYLRHDDSTEQWFSASIAPISNGRAIWIARDITERKQAEQTLKAQSRVLTHYSLALEAIDGLNANKYENFEDLLNAYLQVGCKIFQLPTGIVSHVCDRRYFIDAVCSNLSNLTPHLEFDLGDTYCAEVIRQKKTITYECVGAIASLQNHPVYQNLHLESYLGTPIFVGGEIYGTLNFSATEAKQEPFESKDRAIIELMARDLGKFIAAREVDIASRKIEQKRQEMEYALRQSEARNRGIVSAIPDLMLRIDGKGYYLDYIPAQHSPELLSVDRLGKHLSEVLPPELVPVQMHEIAKALSTGKLQVYERQVCIDDRCYDEEVRIAPSGENEVLVIIRDISEQKWAEIALFEQMRLASLDADIGLALTRNQDLQDTLECCALGLAENLNTALNCIWTIAEGNLKRQAIAGDRNVIENSDRDLEKKLNLDRILAEGKPYLKNSLTDDDRICSLDWMQQHKFTAIAVYPLLVDETAIGILLLCDRTDFSETILRALTSVANSIALGINRHLSDIALQRAKEIAEAANLAKSQFLASMSHELRTPLNAILGFAQILYQDITLQGKQREFISIIEHSGEHLLGLIDDILSMSRIETGHIELEKVVFSIDRLVDNLYSMFQLQAKSKGINLSFHRSSELPSLLIGDESKLRQILINLLGNAIKFTENGSITLQVKEETKGKICFEVSDTGAGISPEELPQIFSAFVQSESGRKSGLGAGLGLALTRKFVELMGGEITVSSRGYIFSPHFSLSLRSEPINSQTVGTVFSLVIPFQTAEQIPQPALQKPIALAPNQPIYRILIVEDTQQNRLLLRSLLIPLGFEIAEAENGEAAIALWEQWQPHLILMDMKMPVMNGDEATRQIRLKEKNSAKTLPHSTAIIALTASVFSSDLEQMLSLGCDDFLSKPFQATILLEKIANLLGVRYLYNTSMAITTDVNSLQWQSSGDRSFPLEILATMPRSWLEKFYQMASVADEEGMRKQIAEIPPEKETLGRSLEVLIDDFRVDLIFGFVQTVLGNKS